MVNVEERIRRVARIAVSAGAAFVNPTHHPRLGSAPAA